MLIVHVDPNSPRALARKLCRLAEVSPVAIGRHDQPINRADRFGNGTECQSGALTSRLPPRSACSAGQSVFAAEKGCLASVYNAPSRCSLADASRRAQQLSLVPVRPIGVRAGWSVSARAGCAASLVHAKAVEWAVYFRNPALPLMAVKRVG